MRVRRPAALAATLVVALVPALAGGAAAGGAAAPSSAAAARAATLAYWTPARMRSAIPRDYVLDASGYHLRPVAKPGVGGNGDTTGAPWPNGKGNVYAATGKVYFVMGAYAYVCSGTALSDTRSQYSIVLTAGHCVYDETAGGGTNGFATNWLFIPQFDSSPTFTCSSTAYGCWDAQALVVNRGFATAGGFNTQATHYDWGFAVVGGGGPTDASNLQLDATVPTFGYSAASTMAASTIVDAFGYPAAGKYHGNDLTYCQGPLGFDSRTGNTNYKLVCGMTGGSSGGPWFSGFAASDGTSTGNSGTIRSLNSYRYSGGTSMYGPIFNSTTDQTYNTANGATGNTIVP
jgi:hypothetical protein